MTKDNTIKYKTESQKPMYIGEVTPEQIELWKANHLRGIFQVIDDNEKHIGYFRNPFRGDVNAALAKADAKEPLATVRVFAELLWLGGSDVFVTDTPEWLGMTSEIRAKMNGVKARLVNL